MIVPPKEYRLIKGIVDMLNEAYPTNNIRIPAQRWGDNNKVIKFTSTPDPYFSAYKTNKIWWLCCTDIYVWRETGESLMECCALAIQEGIKMHHCHVHVTFTAQLKREHKEKISFFIGECSWSEND